MQYLKNMDLKNLKELLNKNDKYTIIDQGSYLIYLDKNKNGKTNNPYIYITSDRVMMDINNKSNGPENKDKFNDKIKKLNLSKYLDPNVKNGYNEAVGMKIKDAEDINEYIKIINLLKPYYLHFDKSCNEGEDERGISKNRANALIIRNDKLVSLFEEKNISVGNKLYNLLSLEKIEDEIKVLETGENDVLKDLENELKKEIKRILYNSITISLGESVFLNNNKDNNSPKNIILFGPPGTGKTYNTIKVARMICNNEDIQNIDEIVNSNDENYQDLKSSYDSLCSDEQNKRIEFITFHQSYGYEEFIEGIRPVLVNKKEENKESNSEVKYELKSGIFKEFCKRAEKDLENNYVFIIDEINRGNISKIFGELITLIEDTKRSGAEESMKVKLPYSGEDFSVPGNVYILGTMNTADKSIASMDTALRRRFEFIGMYPKLDLLKNIKIQYENNKECNIEKILEEINGKLKNNLGKDYQIGHAFFMKLEKLEDDHVRKLEFIKVIKNKVKPLLEEYFFNDEEQISKILYALPKEIKEELNLTLENKEENNG